MEGEVLNHVCHLSSLKELDLKGSHFSSIPTGISRLSNLRVLNLSHCENLQQIPELPLNLQILDACGSNRISLSSSVFQFHSLIDWFKSALKQNSWINSVRGVIRDPGICITIPRSCGILEGISDLSRGNCLKLPPNWYENKDLLGFAICYAYVRSKFEGCRWFLKIKGNGKQKLLGIFSLLSKPGLDSDILACIICYHKAAIKEVHRSYQWTHLVASFGSDARVEGCSIHLIYAKDYVQMPPSMVQASSSRGNRFINGKRKFFSHGF